MEFEYRTAEPSDLEDIMNIYRTAQAYMESYGNPQWRRGFPDDNDVLGGIYGGIIFVVRYNGETAAVFSAVNYDRDYDVIDGKWLTDGNYLAVHRVAVSEKYRGKGAAKYILDRAAVEIAVSRGKGSLRFDTHEKNTPMRGLLLSRGFTVCGTVNLFRDDTSRIAFERII